VVRFKKQREATTMTLYQENITCNIAVGDRDLCSENKHEMMILFSSITIHHQIVKSIKDDKDRQRKKFGTSSQAKLVHYSQVTYHFVVELKEESHLCIWMSLESSKQEEYVVLVLPHYT